MGRPPFIVLWLARPVILVIVVQHGPGQWRTDQPWPLLSDVAVRLPLSQVGRSMLAQDMRRTRARVARPGCPLRFRSGPSAFIPAAICGRETCNHNSTHSGR